MARQNCFFAEPAFLRLIKRKPPAVSRGRFSWRSVVRRSGSEVALNANVQSHRVLVLELVDLDRLRSRRRQRRSTTEILVEVEQHYFGRERQVLDRSPAGDNTELRDVEVRVAAEINRRVNTKDQAIGPSVGKAILALGSGEVKLAAAITDRGPAAEQARRPVWIPVVVVGTTETIGSRQLQVARTTSN